MKFLTALVLLAASVPQSFGQLPSEAKGVVTLAEPIVLRGDGPEFDYQGVMAWSRRGRVERADAATFVYTGPADKPAIASFAHGPIFDGLNLWRYFYLNSDEYPKDEQGKRKLLWSGIGYEFADPSSSTVIKNASFAGWDTAIRIKASTHSEHFLFENLHFYDCKIFFRNEENQAVGHTFTNIFQHRFNEVCFQFPNLPGQNNGGGGNIDIRTFVLLYPSLVFEVGKANTNSGQITLTNFKVDNNARGWRLLKHKDGPLNLVVRGMIGKSADPAPDAIVSNDTSLIDVQMWWNGRVWPRDYHVVNGKWEAK